MGNLIITDYEFVYRGYFYGRIENNILFLQDNVKSYEYKISNKGFSMDNYTPTLWLDINKEDESERTQDYISFYSQYEGDAFGIIHYPFRVCDINFPVKADRDKFVKFLKNEII